MTFGWSWETLRSLVIAYLVLTAAMTAASILRMMIINHRANATHLGRERIDELKNEGHWKQIPLYSFEEIHKKKSLGDVRLNVFPAKGEAKSKYILICPGGGYAHLCTEKEGYAVAARANELGYTAFVLEYRTGFAARHYAPVKDLARAVRHIEEHCQEYQVDPEDYALVGFSAGANMIGLYGNRLIGYEKFGTPKPGILMMGYPWTNLNHWMDHPYWNIWKGLIGVYFTERGNLFVLGKSQSRASRDSLCVQKWIEENYPKTYIFSGGLDVLTPASRHADVMARTLDQHKVPYLYRKYFRLPHGIGLGVGTEAEGWLEDAISYWEQK